MIEIINNQRVIKIEQTLFSKFAQTAFEAIPQTDNKTLTVAFVSDRKMRELNRKFRGKNATTDVLSFPHESNEFDSAESQNNLGDIVISVEQAQRQAAENNFSFELEIKQLVLHGILHLCGHDHETDSGEMNRLELELRDKLGIS